MSTSPYKPSPLSFNSPRRSPFQRSDSRPGSPLTIRASTPTAPPNKSGTPSTSADKRAGSPSPWTSTRGTPGGLEPPTSPSRNPSHGSNISLLDEKSNATATYTRPTSSRTETSETVRPWQSSQAPLASPPLNINNADILSHLPPAHLRSMRESFQVLDSHNKGSIGSADIAAMLQQLGLDASPAALSAFFPPNSSGTINLAAYLNNLASLLAPMSSQEELLAAFEAFDDDDSGQIDVKELKDAIMHTAPDQGERPIGDRELDGIMDGFKGRRAFGKHSAGGLAKGEIFRYRAWTENLGGADEGQHAVKV
ncbi:MAG: hypothetical protein M1820_008863 [Bogoriella megaspora]|nr:MAG: hypothetical protein M1820_008863 [Bogoriella megaspora]